jgi:hypothetical protein
MEAGDGLRRREMKVLLSPPKLWPSDMRIM